MSLVSVILILFSDGGNVCQAPWHPQNLFLIPILILILILFLVLIHILVLILVSLYDYVVTYHFD